MASGGQSFELDCRTKTFNPLNIIIKWSVKSPPIVFDISDILDPRIIKCAISSNKWKAMLQQKRVEISEKNVSDGSLEVTVTKHFEREEDVRNYIVSSLLDSLKDIVCFSMDKKKYNLETIRLEANKKRNSLASDGWTFFDGENEVCFVGEVKDIERLKEDLLVGIYLPKMYKWPVLNELGINQYLNGKSNVIVAGNDVVVRGLLYDAEKAVEEIEHFYKKICKKHVKFKPEDKLHLLFLADGEENKHLVNLLRKSLKEQHVKVCLETDAVNCLVYVSCFEEKEFKKAEDVINDCINYHELSATSYEGMRLQLRKYQEMKLWIVIQDDKKFKLVCSKEVPVQEIIEQVCYVENFPIPDVVCEFLSLHGKDDLEAAALSNNVTATVNKENSVLCIRGTNENKKKFKKQFKDSRCIDSFFLEVHSSFVRKHEGELKRIANARKCCLQANFPKHNAVLHETYKMVATWSHVRSCPNVSLVVGQIEDMQTDYQVVFVTDKLCPLHKCSSDQYSKYLAYMANGEMAETNPGDVVDYYIGREEDKSLTKAIVITKANANVRKDSLDSQKLAQAIDKVLQEAKTKKAGSLAIQISLLYEHLSIKDMVQDCLSIILGMCVKLEVYLVCHQTEDIYRAAKIVDDYYQKKGTGFYRQSHMKDIPFKKNFHHIKTEVEIDSIVDMKVDVIVNTVDYKLKFDKGNLSKIILSRAGSQGILEECKRNYPSGIAFGDIAITGAGNLCNSVKHIFHCALPAFNKSTFVNDVKEMVKKCFLEMDMRKVKTVAFPAFGTGTLGYPKRETAKAMFDAVEEYKYGCINSSLKRVVFVLYQGDKDSCNVFCDEEKRRKQGNTEKIDEKDFPGLHAVVGKGESQVKVTVALDEDLKHLPSNVVLTEFKFQKDGGECEMIYSSTSSSYRNDILKIFTVDRRDDTALSDSIGRLLDYCSEYKIAEVMIPTNNGIMLTTEKQIDVIVKRVQDYVKKKATERLCQVYIGIPSSESLDKIEKQHLKSGPEAFISSIKEKFFSSTLKWSRNTNQANSVEIKIIGLNEELVTQAQNELMEYAKRLPNQEEQSVANKEKKKIVKDPKANYGTHGDKANYGTHGDKIFTDETDSVTAEMNPGIVSYLNGHNKLDLWMNKIMKLYDIKAQYNQGVVEVCGSFSKILDFEKYLEERFLQNEISNERQENTINDWEHSEEEEVQDKGKCVNLSKVQDQKHGQAKYLHEMQNEDMDKAQDDERGNAQNEGEGNIQNKGQDKYLGKTKEDVGRSKGQDSGPDMVQYLRKMQAEEEDKWQDEGLGKLQRDGQEEEQLGQTLDDGRDEKFCEQHEELEKEKSHCNGQDEGQVKMKKNIQDRKLCQTLDEDQHEGKGKMQNTGKKGQSNDKEGGQDKVQNKMKALCQIQDIGQNEDLGEMQYEKQRKGQEEEQGKGQGEEESKGTVEEEDEGPGKGENEWQTKRHNEEQFKGRDENKDNGREEEQSKKQDEDKSKKLGKWQGEEQSKVQDTEQGKEQDEKQGKEQVKEYGKWQVQVVKQGKEQDEEHGQWQVVKQSKEQDEGHDQVQGEELSTELCEGQVKEQCEVSGENESKGQNEGQDDQQDQGKDEELGEEQDEEQCRVQGVKEGKSEGQGEEQAKGRNEDHGRELGEMNGKGQGEDEDKRQLFDSKNSHQPATEQYDLVEGIETYFDNKANFREEQDEEQGRDQNEEQGRDQDEEEVNGQDEEQSEGQCGKHGKEQGEERLKGQVEKQGKGQDEKQGQGQGECHGIRLDEGQIIKLDEKEDKWQNQDKAKLLESLTEDKMQDNGPFGMLNDGQYQREEKDQWNVPDKSKETLYHIVKSDSENSHQPVTEQYDEAEENKVHFDNKPFSTFTRTDIEVTEESLEELKVDCIVLLTNENLETESLNNILKSAGPNYEEDCKKCVTTFGKMISFDCRITHGGSLPCNKILHVLKPSSNIDDLDMSLQVIHDTIEYCLNVADTEKFSTVAIPLVYTGKKTFSKLEAQEHFKAFKSFAKYAKHVRKVCISEKDMTRQNMLMKTYIDIEKEDIETTLTTNYCCNIGTVNISCVIGKLHENQVDALISMEDENFTGTSEIARALLQLGDENYKEAHASLRKEHSKGSVGSVYETKVNGGDLRCKYVFHTIIPRRNKKYARNPPIFEKDIIQTVVNILQKATTLHFKSIAMPLMGYSDELGIPTPLKICCKSMMKGIDGFLQNNSTDVKRIDIIVASSDETENMQIAM